jgi:hypothetical protein
MPDGAEEDGWSLAGLLSEFEDAPPAERIDFRDPILTFGPDCLDPLLELVKRKPDLTVSVSAWLEVLVRRDPETKKAVIAGLTSLSRDRDGAIARAVLDRLGSAARPPGVVDSDRPRPPSAAQAEVHARIIQAAREGRIVTYSDLETSRGHVGKYLFNISRDEAEKGHPPLTSIVVSKSNGRPGDGFLPAMIEIGFAERGEELEDVWHRAVSAVHSFWQERKDG